MAGQPQVPADLALAEALLRQVLGPSADIVWNPLEVQATGSRALLIYVEGLVNMEQVERSVVEPLVESRPGPGSTATLVTLGRSILQVARQKLCTDPEELRNAVFGGDAALLVDGYPGALVLDVRQWEDRPVQSPPTESGLRGPRDGFVETLKTNVTLVRRRLGDSAFHAEYHIVGRRSRTKVALLHMRDITPAPLLEEIRRRLAAVEYDGILDSTQLRELLVGQGFTLFPKMETSERPDKAAAALLSGKVVLLVDNSPFALSAPTTLLDSLWAADDYYTGPPVAALIRLVRALGWMATVFLAPFYIAIQQYNPDLIRSDIALFLAEERMGVPLNAALEIIFLELMMEMISEATVRLPSKVGSTATIVGGLIIGQAAVQAHLLSSGVIIVVAIGAIGSFTLPSQELGQVWRLTKWVMIVAAMTFGVVGILVVSFILFTWIASLDSFGTPYLSPIAPLIPKDLAHDGIVRMPWDRLRRRPKTYRANDSDRAPEPQGDKYHDKGER